MAIRKQDTKDEPFQLLKVKLLVSILPAALVEPVASIKTSLNQHLLKYDSSLGGSPLSYSNVVVSSGDKSGQVSTDRHCGSVLFLITYGCPRFLRLMETSPTFMSE
jgi:hypothetical protein